MPNWRSAAGSSGASRSTSRYSFSALSYCPAAKASLARDRSWSLVGSALEQPALATAARERAKINCRYRERYGLVILEVLIMEVPLMPAAGPARWLFYTTETRARLDPDVRLFNGYRVAAAVRGCRLPASRLLWFSPI